MVAYLQEIDRFEREVTAHVHAQLGDYSRKHYTVNYEDFTAECVAEVCAIWSWAVDGYILKPSS